MKYQTTINIPQIKQQESSEQQKSIMSLVESQSYNEIFTKILTRQIPWNTTIKLNNNKESLIDHIEKYILSMQSENSLTTDEQKTTAQAKLLYALLKDTKNLYEKSQKTEQEFIDAIKNITYLDAVNVIDSSNNSILDIAIQNNQANAAEEIINNITTSTSIAKKYEPYTIDLTKTLPKNNAFHKTINYHNLLQSISKYNRFTKKSKDITKKIKQSNFSKESKNCMLLNYISHVQANQKDIKKIIKNKEIITPNKNSPLKKIYDPNEKQIISKNNYNILLDSVLGHYLDQQSNILPLADCAMHALHVYLLPSSALLITMLFILSVSPMLMLAAAIVFTFTPMLWVISYSNITNYIDAKNIYSAIKEINKINNIEPTDSPKYSSEIQNLIDKKIIKNTKTNQTTHTTPHIEQKESPDPTQSAKINKKDTKSSILLHNAFNTNTPAIQTDNTATTLEIDKISPVLPINKNKQVLT